MGPWLRLGLQWTPRLVDGALNRRARMRDAKCAARRRRPAGGPRLDLRRLDRRACRAGHALLLELEAFAVPAQALNIFERVLR